MNEENPLQLVTCVPCTPKYGSCNKSGRPTNKKIIKFSAQPQSIISKLLKKIKEEQCVSIDDKSQENEPETLTNDSQAENDEILCHNCSHRSSSMKEHQKHIKAHKIFTCDFPNCTYRCKFSSNMIKHKRIHTAEKPYLCDQCSFRSNFVNSLKVHKRIHTDERPFSCSYCSYRCNSSSNLKKHCRHRHPTTETKK